MKMSTWRTALIKPTIISQYPIGGSTVMAQLSTHKKNATIQAWVEPQQNAPSFPKSPRYVLIINDDAMASGTVRPERFSPWSMLPAKARLMASNTLACDPHDVYLDYRIDKKQLRWHAITKNTITTMRDERSLLAIEPASVAILRGVRAWFPSLRRNTLMIMQPQSTQRFQCTIVQSGKRHPLHWCQQKPAACLQLAKQYQCTRWLWLDPQQLLKQQTRTTPDWVPPEQWHQSQTTDQYLHHGEMPNHWRSLQLHQLITTGGGAMRRCPYGD